ncbi:NAD-dependent epimerase/dehydratase family protein [Cyclobacterium sp. 1_MG-2023]|uniref:NAD-dependent epimerase/dehydratase family protein n=1 Tax=Cyclobacterium sp. 1_MG-2023 TaxID=3062681 RepID=UPI0026E20605|nr:NAD-dependent epimerase/dehydratase family protein [Cyclobacterium sp. 1_MG-2023]MDO6438420.1 NAD-dependent epimerase/dehydratase family protein [Cyclobacterium sp. 1_MG-2023]
MNKILVTGAAGQLGTELTQKLCEIHGSEAIIASDINQNSSTKFSFCQFMVLDVMDKISLRNAIVNENICQVYHLAAILSATAEQKPLLAWKLNIDSLLILLDLAKELKLDRIFWPSSIAVFGKESPKENTAQDAVQTANTVYGISKMAGERWCDYYYSHHNVDVRSLRFPGLIGYKAKPGGGTTDYAVDIFHKALAGQVFRSFLEKETRLPMMYMPDAIKATIDLMQAPSDNITVRSSYNLTAMSFTPEEIYLELKKHFPEFKIKYQPDYRQEIASNWPQTIDDQYARNDWNWQQEYNLPEMTKDIIKNLPYWIDKI